MDTLPPRLSVHRHDSDEASWEAVMGTPDPRLAGIVDGSYNGWTERTRTIRRRREVAKIVIPVIINFGPRFGILSGSGPMERFGSFVAGLYDGPVLTEAELTSHCLQVNFTPLGAFRLLGLPLHHLANRVVELEAIFGPGFRRLTERLYEAGDWARRFDLLDRFLLSRLARTPAADPRAVHALRRLERSGGRLGIGRIAEEADLERKQLIGLFHEQVGLAPKMLARLIRFDRAVQSLQARGAALAEVAQDCGYYDQAHFNRDFRAFAGVSPTEFIRASLPEGGGRSGD